MQSQVLSDPEIMHGTPCFRGTRVPVSFLFEILRGANEIHQEFIESYPTVSREQVDALLKQACELLEEKAGLPQWLKDVRERDESIIR